MNSGSRRLKSLFKAISSRRLFFSGIKLQHESDHPIPGLRASLPRFRYHPRASMPIPPKWIATAPLAAALLFYVNKIYAADTPPTQTVQIPFLNHAPVLEDFLQMAPAPAWKGKLAVVDNFIQRQPTDGAPASQRTVVYLGYDHKNLYAIFVCFDTEPAKIRARLSRREDVLDDDSVEIMLDTFYDRRRAYAFAANPHGVQADAVWTEAQNTANGQGAAPAAPGLEGFDFSFDTVWDSRGKITAQGYVVWMAIPFRSLRFSSGDLQMGLLLNRSIPRNNEDAYWPQYSSRISGRLNQEGAATGMNGLAAGRNLQFIPYGTFASFRELDLRDPLNPGYIHRSAYFQVGLDAKAVLKDKFVFDVTLNPDFSQVESDSPQITVSQRFEVFFPEKRPFFLENASYFATPFNLLFTRHIVDPKFGLRVTGKDGPWAVGLLVVDDASPGLTVSPSSPEAGSRAYFAIGRVNRDIGRQSTVGAMFTDREYNGSFNRVGGVDTFIRLNTNWNAIAQALVSSTQRADGSYLAGPAFDAELHRAGRQFSQDIIYNGRADGFRTLPGFDQQPGIQDFFQHSQYTFRPEGRRLISWAPYFDSSWIIDNTGKMLNWGFFPTIKAEFTRQTTVQYVYAAEGETLRPLDFAVLTKDIGFARYTNLFSFQTNFFPKVGASLDYRSGTRVNYSPALNQSPFLARRNSATATLTFRPSRSMKIDNTYLWFRLRDRFSPAAAFNNHIIRSNWNYQMTRALAFRMILQYNAVLPNQTFTNLTNDKSFNADFLVSYMPHPGTAFYLGYNSNLENLFSPLGIDPDGNLLRSPNRFIGDGRHLFAKVSYLFRF
jgi:hypothetical protein